MEIQKYIDIERLKDKYLTAFMPGEHITITEKIDGANASIRYDAETQTLLAFSRRQQLDSGNTLRNFYDFVKKLNIADYAEVLGTRYILFGEWLVKHSIRYPAEAYQKFYVFDLYDTENNMYCTHEKMTETAACLGLPTVPVLYTGEFTSWEEISKLVGMTKLEAQPKGEGIVIKSQDRLENRRSSVPSYIKIVSAEFSEVHKSKKHTVNQAKATEQRALTELAGTVVTERRVEKLLQKFIEDGLLPEDWDESYLPKINKMLPKACFEDCRKEEPEFVAQIPDFGKFCARICMSHAKNLKK